MKYSIFFLFFLITLFAKGQDYLIYQFVPQPNKTYVTTNIYKMRAEGKIESETPFTMTLEGNTKVKSITKTKNETNKKTPYVTEFPIVEMSQKFNEETSLIENPLKGSTIYGYYYEKDRKKVDSISNNSLDSHEKNSLRSQLEHPKAESEYMDVPIRLGDSFEKITVMAFPVLGLDEQEFLIKTKFTLKKIENGIGYFDTEVTFRLKDPNQSIEIMPKSIGYGQREFDIQNQCIIKEITDINLHLKVQNDGYFMTSVITTKHSEITTIQGNHSG